MRRLIATGILAYGLVAGFFVSPVSAQENECDTVAYSSRIPSGAKSGITLIEMKTETHEDEGSAKTSVKSDLDKVVREDFKGAGRDHSEDTEAIEVGASEFSAIIPYTTKMGSISGYTEGKMSYVFYLENSSGSSAPFGTSDYSFELIGYVQASKSHTLEEVLTTEKNLFDGTWSDTSNEVLSCR